MSGYDYNYLVAHIDMPPLQPMQKAKSFAYGSIAAVVTAPVVTSSHGSPTNISPD